GVAVVHSVGDSAGDGLLHHARHAADPCHRTGAGGARHRHFSLRLFLLHGAGDRPAADRADLEVERLRTGLHHVWRRPVHDRGGFEAALRVIAPESVIPQGTTETRPMVPVSHKTTSTNNARVTPPLPYCGAPHPAPLP